MTQKLYYEDCHLTRFLGKVLSCRQEEKGYAVVLERTAFYPEGGGQACDLGTLADAQVLDVQEQGEAVVHFCDRPLLPGSTVEGVIDYQRRLELMQQHTGEHIVSGIICRRFGCHNVGFHVGTDVIQIDFDQPIPPQELPSIEKEANEALWKNLPVRCWYPSPEQLPQVSYRSKRALPWPVRIVEIPGYDACACCGVHVQQTGEVGLIKIFSAVGLRGGSRLEMSCGSRALRLLNTAFEQNRQVSQAFSAQWQETGAAARRMNELLAEEKYRAAELRRQIFESVALRYEKAGSAVHFEAGLDAVETRQLADAIAQCCGGAALVLSGSDAEGYAFAAVKHEGDLRSFGKALTGSLQGRGGGKPNLQQGRIPGSRRQIEAFLKEYGPF